MYLAKITVLKQLKLNWGTYLKYEIDKRNLGLLDPVKQIL